MAGRLSLAQQVALLEESGPIDVDTEDARMNDADDQTVPDTSATAKDTYFEVGPSSLRRQLHVTTDPKYEGIRTTRKELMENSSDEEETVNENDEERRGSEDEHPVSSAEEIDTDDYGRTSNEKEKSEKELPLARVRSSQKRTVEEENKSTDFSTELRKRLEEDRKKGKAVTQQIAMWDSLIDVRIRLQKSLVAANRLPPTSHMKKCLSVLECHGSISTVLKEGAALSEEIFQLIELSMNETVNLLPQKRKIFESDEDTTVDYDQWLQDATFDASNLEAAYHPHLVQNLAKWSSKVQAVAPSVLLPQNKGVFSRNSRPTKTILHLIDETLADRDKLLARTHIKRTKGTRVCVPKGSEDITAEGDPNIWDDTDFYQQLLREIIESKGSGVGDDWMALQRQKKAKKKVDTKASKGRRLRYETHEKLQNFMVPMPVIGGWHEEQTDELFSSLLGKGYEDLGYTNEEFQGKAKREEEIRLSEALKRGFRVFG